MKQNSITLELLNDRATFALGEHIAQLCPAKTVIYLHGELGTGKTTFARGFLHGKGFFGKVKSPTYTLLEAYTCPESTVYHLDLYRLKSAEELEFLGIRDYVSTNGILLIEWPEQGEGFLPAPTLKLTLDFLDDGRKINLAAVNVIGQEILEKFEPRQSYRSINMR